ncbi:MAG: serine/threonine protein kinase [Steroidobacteraceae bacterium]|nr:serine/threonine protein kinase [Steroidobacteraceae bacterium]
MIDKTADAAVKPFAGLTPDVVLDAAASLGFESDGRLFALNSYENRVYQLGRPEGALVLKFYRPARWSDAQILEEHAFTAELAAAELAVAAPLEVDGTTLFRFQGFRFAVFPWMRGRAPELDAPEARAMLGRALARLHRIGSVRPFVARERLSLQRMGFGARDQVIESGLLPAALEESYLRATETVLERVERVFDEVGPLTMLRVHGDCHLGNLLWNPHGPVFVDLDDCQMAPAIQDLWMLLSGSEAEQRRQWRELIEGYEQFRELDFRELRLIEPLRALRMVHHAAWLATRWSDPAFPRAFTWFGTMRYWEGHINDLLEQAAAVDDPPLLTG